jgi:hypothetical protein
MKAMSTAPAAGPSAALALGERIRTELSALVDVTSSPQRLRHAFDAVVAGRTDLVHGTERS